MPTEDIKDPTVIKGLRERVENSHSFFEKNYKMFQKFLYFTFVTNLSRTERSGLAKLKKPPLTFNICEPYISRLCGEFVKYEPNVIVKPADGIDIVEMSEEYKETLDVIAAHLRETFVNINNDRDGYRIYRELLAGGFSVIEIYVDYSSPTSFNKNIYMEKVHNPCLCGFDPTATTSHKGDGDYAFKNTPFTEEDFEKEYGRKFSEKIKYNESGYNQGFSWSYKNTKTKIALVCEMYKKVSIKEKLFKIADSDVLRNPYLIEEMRKKSIKPKTEMYKGDYEKMLEVMLEMGLYDVPPDVIDRRDSERDSIVKYTFCEDEVLSYEKTDFNKLPLIFVSGNSIDVQSPDSDSYEQVTRPYTYNLESIQKIKNFAGQTMAAEINNIQQTKIIASMDGVPPGKGFMDAYKNPQNASVILFNEFKKDNPEIRVTPPREMQRSPTPSIVTDTFAMADRMAQSSLGSYDAEMGMQRNDVSGKAIESGALMSNAASIPYYVGYICGMSRAAEVYVDLMPKYMKTPRTIPVMYANGKRDYRVINRADKPSEEDGNPSSLGVDGNKKTNHVIMMDYNPDDLMVKIETGASFSIQRQMALKTLESMMQVMPRFGQFMNEAGINVVLDNLEFKGSDKLKDLFAKWEKQQQPEQAKQQQFTEAMKNIEIQERQADIASKQSKSQSEQHQSQIEQQKVDNKHQMDIAKVMQDGEKMDGEIAIKAAKNSIAAQEADIDAVLAINEIKQSNVDAAIAAERIQAENARTAADNALKVSEHIHKVTTSNRNIAKEILDETKVKPRLEE